MPAKKKGKAKIADITRSKSLAAEGHGEGQGGGAEAILAHED